MDPNTYQITVPVLVAGLLVLGWWFWRRMVDKSDKVEVEAQKAKDDAIAKQFADLKAGGEACEKAFQEIRLDLANRVTHDKLEAIRADFKTDFKELSEKVDTMVLALGRGRRKG